MGPPPIRLSSSQMDCADSPNLWRRHKVADLCGEGGMGATTEAQTHWLQRRRRKQTAPYLGHVGMGRWTSGGGSAPAPSGHSGSSRLQWPRPWQAEQRKRRSRGLVSSFSGSPRSSLLRGWAINDPLSHHKFRAHPQGSRKRSMAATTSQSYVGHIKLQQAHVVDQTGSESVLHPEALGSLG